jgi:hypothetical protein
MKYKLLILIAAFIAAGAFGYHEFTSSSTPCRDGLKHHAYSSWKSTGDTTRTWTGGRRVLQQRYCFRCGHIDSQGSD